MKNSTPSLLDNLHHADWDTAVRTFGNNHATLIGLLVQWWIRLSLETHTVLEAAPENGYEEAGKRGRCDALFCADYSTVGVLEVEGAQQIQRAQGIGYYFDGRYPEIETIMFGILLVYPVQAAGRGKDRRYPPAITKGVVDTVREVSERHSQKQIILFELDKGFEHTPPGIRSRGDKYKGVPNRIGGQLWQNGAKKAETTYYPTGTSGIRT